MPFNWDSEKIVEILGRGAEELFDTLRQFLSESEARGLAGGIELGISNTVSALYEAGVSDGIIANLLNKYWGIPMEDADRRLLFEKEQAPWRELEHFLKLRGKSPDEIQEFKRKNSPKIRHNPQLWDLRHNPEKLLKELEKLD